MPSGPPRARALPRRWLGVCGWPVSHSLSPPMHNAALADAGLRDWRYTRLGLPPEIFAEAVRALPARGFAGVNVTVPHKEAALALADEATHLARGIGAANTLTFREDGSIHADNTDAPGLLAAIPPHHDPRGRTALVLGAGGAARAAVYALAHAGARVLIWNRTPQRAAALAAELGAEAVGGPVAADLVVNCTTVGLDGSAAAVKGLPLHADYVGTGSCVVDMVYRPGGTPLLTTARAWGADTVDGLEILIAQGAASFRRWTGKEASLSAMRRALSIDSPP